MLLNLYYDTIIDNKSPILL